MTTYREIKSRCVGLGEALQRARDSLRLTDRDVATTAGIPVSTVAAAENGYGSIDLHTLLRVAAAVGCTLTVRPTARVWIDGEEITQDIVPGSVQFGEVS